MVDYQICTRCVMDTTAEEIKFDSKGVCSFCHHFDENVKPILELSLSGESKKMLEAIVTNISRLGRQKRRASKIPGRPRHRHNGLLPGTCTQAPLYKKSAPVLPVAERLSSEVLSLPIWPNIGEDVQGEVAEAIRAFMR